MLHDLFNLCDRKCDVHYRTIGGQHRVQRIFRHAKCMWVRSTPQIFYSKCSRLTMRDHYCRFCSLLFRFYCRKFSGNFHISRGRYAIAREISEKNDRKIHIVRARTANSCHAVKLLTIKIINFYWIFFSRVLSPSSSLAVLLRNARRVWGIVQMVFSGKMANSRKECYSFGALLSMTREQTTTASQVRAKQKRKTVRVVCSCDKTVWNI